MKDHILTALREQLNHWDELLSTLTEEQIESPGFPADWSIKDAIAHLWTWQKRSIARLEAAHSGREPEFPQWVPGLVPDTEGVNDRINAWIYETNRDLPWTEMYQSWKEGFLHFLKLGEGFSEREMLDSDKYPWMEGYSLADVLIGSYDHHREHMDYVIEGMSRLSDRKPRIQEND